MKEDARTARPTPGTGRLLFCLFAIALLLALSGCSALTQGSLQAMEVTPVPGVIDPPLSPMAAPENQGTINAALYFRFMAQNALACESRVLSLQPNESAEKAVIQALLDGPSAGAVDLQRLYPANTRVLDTNAKGDMLIVTFSAALMDLFDDEPANWQQLDAWREEVPLRRKLAMDSLIATITENFRYRTIQVLVEQSQDDDRGSMRLDNAYYRDPGMESGPAMILERNESTLLTPYHTAELLLSAWERRDWQTLYSFVIQQDPATASQRPMVESAYEAWNKAPYLISAVLSAGNVSPGGNQAIFTVDMALVTDESTTAAPSNYLLRLTRDGGIWKITYNDLEQTMQLAIDN